jgi:two-component system chemotaxis response regulator CheY
LAHSQENNMPPSKRILDVGQCIMDGPRLGRFLTREFHCSVDRAHTKDEALTLAATHPYNLALVNRVLDRDRSPGLDVIAALRAAHPTLPVMLVSDFPDAQAQATSLGALPGFGKSALESPQTQDLLRAALATPATPHPV